MKLSGDWKFYLGDAEEAWYQGFDDSAWRTVTLPHDWAVEAEFSQDYSSGTGYLPAGVGWYRRHFSGDAFRGCRHLTLTFDGVYNNAQVWINSNYLGRRPYGYSGFSYDIAAYLKDGDNVIAVKVSHLHAADSRWYTGSGIYRRVRLTPANDPCFPRREKSVFCRTVQADEDSAVLEIDYTLNQAGNVRFCLFDGETEVAAASARGADGTVTMELRRPKRWSTEAPQLYRLVCTALDDSGACSDRLALQIGMRTMRFDADRGFFLNETPMKLKGVCLHHDAGALGAAFYDGVWERRLHKLKNAGCNAIRTSHNPPDPGLLDLCDRLGFLVLDEAFDEWEGCKNKWWQGHNVYPPKHYGYYEDFPEWHERDLADLVLRDRNRACVFAWSIGNEIDYPNDPYVHTDYDLVTGNNDANKPEQERRYDRNKPDARRLAVMGRELAAIVKRCDPTRPVTAALSFPEMSERIGLTDALDIAGYNYRENLYAPHRASHPDRVILGTENGHAPAQWYAVRDREDISAQFLWTGIDYLGECTGWPTRASGAGILDLAGFEKPRYYQRKALWSDQLSAKVVSAPAGTQWQERFSWRYEPGTPVEVIVYTNADTVELAFNGASLGVKTRTDDDGCCVKWELPFSPGTVCATCRRGAETVYASLQSTGGPDTIRLRRWRSDDPAIVQVEAKLCSHRYEPTDVDADLTFAAEGGALLGIENGDRSDLTPYSADHRRTHKGRLIAYFRPAADAKKIRITASAEGLPPAVIEIDPYDSSCCETDAQFDE